MSRKSKVGTESGGTWHHPRAIEWLLNNGKQPRGCNRVNLVEVLRSGLVKSVELGLWSLTYGAQEDGQPK